MFGRYDSSRVKPEINLLLTTGSHAHDGCLTYLESIWSVGCAHPYKLTLHVSKSQGSAGRSALTTLAESFEHKLIDRVCNHPHDVSLLLHSYKNACQNSWCEICTILEVNIETCKNKWKQVCISKFTK